jgi:hypothetical protein
MKKLLPLLVLGLLIFSGCSWFQQPAAEEETTVVEEEPAMEEEPAVIEEPIVEEEPTTAEASSESPEVVLAKCITESGAKLYTAVWCGHCKNQKAAFGDGLEYLDNTECAVGDGWAQECTDAGVKAVPTWIFGDGTSKSGNTPLATLADLTGCTY